ncbi:MAG: AraC family transcriptional regulator [Thermoanaerobaculia bacterium]|nr:AraC family transcriptional regulator [Thermoanaerobaculia bacterium]
MDALSRILDGVEMRGSLYFPAELRSPWGLAVPSDEHVCRFHVAVEGSCHLTCGGRRVQIARGDLALVPHGRDHLLQDDPATPTVDLESALAEREYDGRGVFRWGEDGVTCRLVCGHFSFDREAARPLLEALPGVIHIQATPTYDFRWIDQVMRFIGEEMNSERPGSRVISRRLSEVLFVQVIRHYAETASEPVPVLAGIVDPRLSRALEAMHRELDRAWTVEALASEAGMSRTAFSVHFKKLIGRTPIEYLTSQRMIEAGRLLRAGESSGAVADRVGYRSEAAFARRFKQVHGIGPGGYRRSRSAVS